jgi:hypothetical protein
MRLGLTRRNALAISPGFSMLPGVRRPSDGPDVDLVRCYIAWCKLRDDLLAARVLPARPTCREGIITVLTLISEAVPGPGGAWG